MLCFNLSYVIFFICLSGRGLEDAKLSWKRVGRHYSCIDQLLLGGSIFNGDRDREDLIYMMIDGENTTILAVFVHVLKAPSELLKEHAHGEGGECCISPFQNKTAWTVLAISFISFIVILIAISAPRHWLYSRGRSQLPKSVDTKVVDALPCLTFSSTRLGECHSEETCAICFENYIDVEILKVPCQHERHSSSVHSWLTKWGCSVCKHDMRTKSVNPEIKRRTWLQFVNVIYDCPGNNVFSCLFWSSI